MSRFHTLKCVVLAATLAIPLVPGLASAQSHPVGPREGDWSTHAGAGFTLGPDGALLAVGAEYAAADWLHMGPLVQIGLDDDHTIVAPTLNFRFAIDLSESRNEFVQRLEPYVQTGFGFAYINKERRGRDREDTGFLVNGGFGAEYWVTDDLAVGNGVLFNGLPDRVAGEDFFLSWQMVTLRYRF